MTKFYINNYIIKALLELKTELYDISSKYLYAPLTEANFIGLQKQIEHCLNKYNKTYFEHYGFMAYSSLDVDINNIFGGIHFKSLRTNTDIILCPENERGE